LLLQSLGVRRPLLLRKLLLQRLRLRRRLRRIRAIGIRRIAAGETILAVYGRIDLRVDRLPVETRISWQGDVDQQGVPWLE